jgi:ATP-dependent Clp protease ATP-binding subunit ClpA
MIRWFGSDARLVVRLAHVEARRMGHRHLGTEHLLVGLLREERGPAARALAALGVTADAVEHEIVARIGSSEAELDRADAEALRAVGIDLEQVREHVEAAFGPGALRPPAPERRGLCRRARRALELSLREAMRRGDRHIGSEHVLLALNSVEAGLGAQILRDLGASSESVRTSVLDELRRAS